MNEELGDVAPTNPSSLSESYGLQTIRTSAGGVGSVSSSEVMLKWKNSEYNGEIVRDFCSFIMALWPCCALNHVRSRYFIYGTKQARLKTKSAGQDSRGGIATKGQ